MANTVQIPDVVVIKDTGRALLCEIEGEQIWIPQSQIDEDSEVYQEGDEGTLVITEWIAEQKGLI